MLLKVTLQNGVVLTPFEFYTNEPALLLLGFGSAAHCTQSIRIQNTAIKASSNA
jgi:ABC-type uncharacterized transport system permease subunit